jgi:hypothetical protein
MANLSHIKSQIDSLTIDELRELNKYIVDNINEEKRKATYIAKKSIAVGMRVRINHPKANGVYIIDSIGRTKAVMVKEGESSFPHICTTAPISLLQVI